VCGFDTLGAPDLAFSPECLGSKCREAVPRVLTIRFTHASGSSAETNHRGIIGAGNIGSALTRRFTTAGHQVFVANSRGPQTLTKLAAETGAKPVSLKEAVHAGGVVVVTIPEKNISSLPIDLFKDVPASVVVIDTGNYYPRQRDGRIDAIENGMPESQWVAQQALWVGPRARSGSASPCRLLWLIKTLRSREMNNLRPECTEHCRRLR
jgi:NADP oxidoreductase coenzyme F420-dependent